MKMIVVVKFVPDVDSFNYDYENSTLVREGIRQILNPDDACALGFALKHKKDYPDTEIQVLTMAPTSIMPHLEDFVRVGVDRCILLSDPRFSGSDSFVTSLILAKYLSLQSYDCILTGTHAIDGDTSHVPPQIAERLRLDQLSGVVSLAMDIQAQNQCQVTIENEHSLRTFSVRLPAVLSVTRESGYKMPYVKRADMDKMVNSQIEILNADVLGLKEEQIGFNGSLTRVVKTYTKHFETKDKHVVTVDEEGIKVVINFLKDKGLLK